MESSQDVHDLTLGVLRHSTNSVVEYCPMGALALCTIFWEILHHTTNGVLGVKYPDNHPINPERYRIIFKYCYMI